MQYLDRRFQCRPVMLPEYGLSDDDPPVWINALGISIVCNVVQNQMTNAVGDIRLNALIHAQKESDIYNLAAS